ncbi:xanthine dehydrogenase family protein molybdopterin-binding subunit [Deinococcus cellulosilyticus]|uniref:Aldehyde oxidase n=1 Tax=Deinococcus cellulosilyticus (strain DSM 18568 / NBRC 106333 / KACC 11606 / 5516J-15) TaxID=1223518 RepID=A0A511N8Q6_DEIC1|nr:molybdopterin cofactor-binding domain-containing protein [Deinococcus cellulosilyticus]GEM49214.1 aldehyde oxidase [Deinococcus cellulosilyticus NBRC 106333 = KACC 11606]
MSSRKWRITRRQFLIGLGTAGGAVALGFYLGKPAMQLKLAEGSEDSLKSQAKLPKTPDAWFEIREDSTLRLYVTKSEMGQGIHTALAQLAAEELGLKVTDLDVVQSTTRQGPKDSFGTGASASILTSFRPMREAAATFREMLLKAGSGQLQKPAEQLELTATGVRVKGTEQQALYADLARQEGMWEVPKTPPVLKKVRGFQVIGTSAQRIDLPAKVTGEAIYGYDARLPGMLYGAVLRPPTLEANLKSADVSQVSRQPGVKTVHVDLEAGFVGVVAQTRNQARNALRHVKAVWDQGKLWQQKEILDLIRPEGKAGVTFQREGKGSAGLKQGNVIRAEYRSPFAVQAAMEPQAALADVKPEGVKIWASTQYPFRISSAVSKKLGIKEETIEVIPTYLGGGFGSKINSQAGLEAAILSKAAGAPVHVGWDRTEEMTQGFLRPPTHSVLSAVLKDGKIETLEHRIGSGVVAFSTLPSFLETLMGADFGSYAGGKVLYDIPNRQGISYNPHLPVRTGWWRGLGLFANTFALESFMDELAAESGTDPLEFRLKHLPASAWGVRMRKVLQTVARESRWGKPRPSGRALGLACGSSFENLIAQVAEVSIDQEKERVKVHRIWCAMDPGLVINPDGAKAQIQGAVMWGVSSALKEEVLVKDGKITAQNFTDYPLLSLEEAPDIQTFLLEDGSGEPRGVGEPPIAPVGAAIGNAIFALTGKRLREVPFNAERLRSAGILV